MHVCIDCSEKGGWYTNEEQRVIACIQKALRNTKISGRSIPCKSYQEVELRVAKNRARGMFLTFQVSSEGERFDLSAGPLKSVDEAWARINERHGWRDLLALVEEAHEACASQFPSWS